MTPAARERALVRTPLLVISATAWILLAVQSASPDPVAHCVPDASRATRLPVSLALGWALMLAAMMTPVLIAPVRHVRERSLANRRARATWLFVTAYGSVWMAAGGVLITLALGVRLAAPGWLIGAALGGLIAIVWELSPFKQRCLNRGHTHAHLPAFGRTADRAALRFGIVHGLWCAGSCWALMLLPLLFESGHLAGMAVVSLWLYAERLERPAPPRWRLRVPARAARMVMAQVRIGY